MRASGGERQILPEAIRASFTINQSNDVLGIDAILNTQSTKRAAWRAALRSSEAAAPYRGSARGAQPAALTSRGRRGKRNLRRKHQGAARIGQRAHDVERGASAISLLQGPVAHVQLEPKQHAMVGDLCTEELEVV